MALKKVEARGHRHTRVRKKIAGTAERPRLAVFRSNKHIYAQLIDDVSGRTLVAASALEADAAKEGKKSLAIEVTLQPQDATLTDAALEGFSKKLVEQLEKATGGTLRS